MTAELEAALAASRSLNTATLNLGRFTPTTRNQRESALAGIAQCDTDWPGNVKISDEMTGKDEYWKAGYRIRSHEHEALERKRGTALERRYSGYAAKFVNDSDEAPTDANLERVLAGCARPARPEDYPCIRPYVPAFRILRAKVAGGNPRVLRQDALRVVSVDPAMARAFDEQWDGGDRETGKDCQTVGEQFEAIDKLAAYVLRSFGYEVR